MRVVEVNLVVLEVSMVSSELPSVGTDVSGSAVHVSGVDAQAQNLCECKQFSTPHGEVRLARDAVAREGSVLHAIKMA